MKKTTLSLLVILFMLPCLVISSGIVLNTGTADTLDFQDDAGNSMGKLTDEGSVGNWDISGQIKAGSNDRTLTNSGGDINGEYIQDDTIDDDSLDFTDITLNDITIDNPKIIFDFVIKSPTTTLTSSETGYVVVSTQNVAHTYTLPVSTACADGVKIAIKHTGGANVVTIGRQASDKIDSASADNTDIDADNDILIFMNDLANNDWVIIGGYIH